LPDNETGTAVAPHATDGSGSPAKIRT
jgi:hypothetical protein